MDPIEVEVLEVDGQPPAPPVLSPVSEAAGVRPYRAWEDPDAAEPATSPYSRATSQHWSGSVGTLNPLWWPLLLILGVVLLFLVLTVGAVVAILLLILRLIRGVFRALFS